MTTENFSNLAKLNQLSNGKGLPPGTAEKAKGQRANSLDTLANAKKFTSHLDANLETVETSRPKERNFGQERAAEVHERNDARRAAHEQAKDEAKNRAADNPRAEHKSRADSRDNPATDTLDQADASTAYETEEAPEQSAATTDAEEDNSALADQAENSETGDAADADGNRAEGPAAEAKAEETTGDNETSDDTAALTANTETVAETLAQQTILAEAEAATEKAGENIAALNPATAGETPDAEAGDEADPALLAKAGARTGKDAQAALNNTATGSEDGEEAEPGLQSTLGEESKSKTDKAGRNSNPVDDLARAIKDAPVQKDAAQQLAALNNPAQPTPQQGAAGEKAGLNSALLGGFKNQDVPLLNSQDGADGIASLNGTADGKATPASSQLRAAGYTSPTQSLALQIAQKVQNGAQQFEIRMNPPELGRVDVKLDFNKDGHMTTHLTIERPETLEMLTRDSRQLERALQQSGLNISGSDLTFSLKQEGESAGQQFNAGFEAETSGQNPASENEPELSEAIYRRLANPSGIDISI